MEEEKCLYAPRERMEEFEMLKVYGTPICKDCLAMKIIFEELGVEYEYVKITDNTTNLKEFLKIRDQEELYAGLRKDGGIGIPLFVKDGMMSFDINEALTWENFERISEEKLARITEECVLLCR